MSKKKILIVDDSSVVRGLLTRLIGAQADMEIVATAANGQLGVSAVDKSKPDLVIMDIEMPVMTGIEAVTEIRKHHQRLPIIMFSTLTSHGANATMTAIDAGASDFALKPSSNHDLAGSLQDVQQELLGKMRSLLGITAAVVGAPKRPAPERAAPPRPRPASPTSPAPRRATGSAGKPSAVVIGSSTGGPIALDVVMRSITHPLDIPIFIVQHMPPLFTKALADRLNRNVSTTVVEAEHGMVAEPGHCYIAPGAHHMRLERHASGAQIELFEGELINSCRPSVEPLFESAAELFGSRLIAAMLTGMGADGATSTGKIADLGCDVIAQDEATSVVYGMPRAVIEAGYATHVLPIDQIGVRIAQLAGSRAGGRAVAA